MTHARQPPRPKHIRPGELVPVPITVDEIFEALGRASTHADAPAQTPAQTVADGIGNGRPDGREI